MEVVLLGSHILVHEQAILKRKGMRHREPERNITCCLSDAHIDIKLHGLACLYQLTYGHYTESVSLARLSRQSVT